VAKSLADEVLVVWCGVVLLSCCCRVVLLCWCCVAAVVEALHFVTKVGCGSLCGPARLSATASCILESGRVVPAQTSAP